MSGFKWLASFLWFNQSSGVFMRPESEPQQTQCVGTAEMKGHVEDVHLAASLSSELCRLCFYSSGLLVIIVVIGGKVEAR